MKNALKITLALALTLSMFNGVSQNYGTSSTRNFDRCVRSIEATNNSKARCNNAISHFKNRPSTTLQLQQVCYYLSTDEEKYNLCVAAYPNVIDKVNFYNIYDSFSTFSNVMRLYHNTEGKNNTHNNNYTTHQTNQQNDQQVKNATFDLLVKKGDVLLTSRKINAAIAIYEEAKIIKPNNQLIIMKLKDARRIKQDQVNSYEKNKVVFDMLIKQGDKYMRSSQFYAAINTYQEARALKPMNQLATMKIKEASRMKQAEIDQANVVVECTVSDAKFNQIHKAIEDQTFPDKQMVFAKQYISKECFSTPQYQQIITVLTMDSDKLELIKYLHKYTNQPEDMHSFKSLLTFSSTKQQLDNFILKNH
jgi:tetratricopeptide (TPR) repeat protein